jgi:hypothetical protein
MSDNTRKLNTEEQKLLREIVSKYLADDSERLLSEAPDRWLSPLLRSVRDAIGEELAGSGFDQNYEPTARGRLLEGLIDYLNRLEFAPKS